MVAVEGSIRRQAMSTRYVIVGIDNTSRPLLSGHKHSLAVARVMDVELGGEPLSRKTVDGVIRLAADQQGFGKYVDIDEVFKDLVKSGFLETSEK